MNFYASATDRPDLVREAALRPDPVVASSDADPSSGGPNITSFLTPSSPKSPSQSAPRRRASPIPDEINVQHTTNRYTALHEACFHGHVDVVRTLLQQKAQVDVRDRDGRTPMELAIYHSHSPCVLAITEYLKSLDKDPNVAGERRVVLPRSPRLLAPKLLEQEVAKIDLREISALGSAGRRRSSSSSIFAQTAANSLGSTDGQNNSPRSATAPAPISVDYRRRKKFERPVSLADKERKNPKIMDVKAYMQKTQQKLGSQSLGNSIHESFRYRLRVNADARAADLARIEEEKRAKKAARLAAKKAAAARRNAPKPRAKKTLNKYALAAERMRRAAEAAAASSEEENSSDDDDDSVDSDGNKKFNSKKLYASLQSAAAARKQRRARRGRLF